MASDTPRPYSGLVQVWASPTAWKEADVDVSTFEAHVIGGPFDPDVAATLAPAPPRVTADGLARLTAHCADNLVALARRRHPSCYSLQAPDGTVHAISLAVSEPDGVELTRLSRLSTVGRSIWNSEPCEEASPCDSRHAWR